VAVAVVVAVLLLQASDDGGSTDQDVSTSGQDGGDSSPTTAAEGGGTTETSVTAPQAHAPNEVKVVVLNGSGVQGAAGKVANQLKAENYIAVADNAAARVNATTVYFQPGYEADARAIADLLKQPPPAVAPMPNPPPDPKVGDNNVAVVLAADVASAR
jgi:hypothetical protein